MDCRTIKTMKNSFISTLFIHIKFIIRNVSSLSDCFDHLILHSRSSLDPLGVNLKILSSKIANENHFDDQNYPHALETEDWCLVL